MGKSKKTDKRKRVLVTGGSGFVGRALIPVLKDRGWIVRAALRNPQSELAEEVVPIPEISGETDWSDALKGCDAVVHLAGRAHVLGREDAGAEKIYADINAEGPRRLAEDAVKAGVDRYVFVSTAKVQGEGRERPYTEADIPDPQDPYARSKWMAEQYVTEIGLSGDMPVIVLRPPLIYGPGVKANFLRMLGWTAKGVPLPFGSILNRRSYLYVGNLADAITRSLEEDAVSGTYLISDGEDLSTPELIKRLGRALQKRPFLLGVPKLLLVGGAKLLGRGPDAERLTGSFAVDSSAIRQALQWVPPYTVDDGLAATASWFKQVKSNRD